MSSSSSSSSSSTSSAPNPLAQAQAHLRIARPTDSIPSLLPFYVDGLGFEVRYTFNGHEGFDGVLLALAAADPTTAAAATTAAGAGTGAAAAASSSSPSSSSSQPSAAAAAVGASAYHIEFTQNASHRAGRAPTQDNLLVFYVPDSAPYQGAIARMRRAGFEPVASLNPYWDRCGTTFEDPDGYRVVLANMRSPV